MKKALSLVICSVLLLTAVFSLDSSTSKLLEALLYENKDYQLIENAINSDANLLYIESNGKKLESITSKLVLKIYQDSWDFRKSQSKYQKAVSILNLFFEKGGKLQYVDSEILFFGIHSEMPEVVELLLKNGASPSFWIASALGKTFRNTPLQEAYSAGMSGVTIFPQFLPSRVMIIGPKIVA